MLKNNMTSVPQGGATEQPANIGGSKGEDSGHKTISTEQEDNAQAGAAAGTVQTFKPVYSDKELLKLNAITAVSVDEIERVINDPTIEAVPYAGGANCVVDLRKVADKLYTPQVNRTHGKDEVSTGESLRTYGSQHPLLIITVKMAEAAGLVPVRFGKDPHKDEPISEDGFVLMDGNGRINYLLGVEVENWPEIYGVFPSKDAAGYYNLNKSFDIINTQVSVWKTQDMVQKRQLMDAEDAHPGWGKIEDLIKKGYRYQSACQLVTLGTDRIKKTAVIDGDAESIFIHYESAMKILPKLQSRFGEDYDTLKTKEFTMTISKLWLELQKKSGDEKATEVFLKFLDGLSDDVVTKINNAKTSRKALKGIIRKDIIDTEFKKFNKARVANQKKGAANAASVPEQSASWSHFENSKEEGYKKSEEVQ